MAEQANPLKKKFREFKLSSFALDNSTSIFILTIMIMIFGVQAYDNMPKEQFPEVAWPTVYITTPYFGNSAADIENLITRPIEKELQSITGIKDIKSTSIQDFSMITAEFAANLDLDESVRKVKDAVDKSKAELPTDLDQEPSVLDIDLSEIPIVTINVSGDYTPDELRNYAEYMEDKIEELDEVAEVELKGALEREVKVDIDLPKMEAVKVSFGDVENAIASENITMSGGELVNNDFRRAIRVKGEFESVNELNNLIVKSEDQRPIFLKDIAKVSFGFKDRTSIARSDGLPVISLDVIKRKGENLLSTIDHIKEIEAEAGESLPEDLKISFFNDQSVYTRDAVSNLENSIISGVILVVIVLLFFLGTRNSLFVGLAIPLSMVMGILVLSIMGETLNMIVLFALILALGMLVDNAIVVVENIYRYRQEGYPGYEAAKYGAGEVAVPIIASTATTLAAFIPLAFWPGIMGEFLKYLPITLIIVLTSSLFVALVINTVFTSKLMKVDEGKPDKATRRRKRRNVLIGVVVLLIFAVLMHFGGVLWARNLLAVTLIITLLNFFILTPSSIYFQNTLLPLLEKTYDWFIHKALRVPGLVFAGTFVLLFVAMGILAFRMPPISFFPTSDPVYVNVFVELPLGKDIEATDRLMREIEEKVTNTVKPYSHIVEAVLSQIGENTADPSGPPEPGASPHKARLTVAFVPAKERGDLSTFDIMNEIRESLQGYAGVKIVVDKNSDGPPTGKPVNLEIQGEDIDQLVALSDEVISYINSKNVPGIEELKADVQLGKPEVIVNINREAARRYEISTFSIANSIRTSVFGSEVSKYKEGEDEYPIFVRLDKKYRNNIDNLLNQQITFRSAATGQLVQVPISAVADIEYSSSYSSIKRKNLDRVVTVYSNIVAGYYATEIIPELRNLMAVYPLPEGIVYEFTGEQEQQAEDIDFLNTAFMVVLFSIFLILIAQFNSLLSPVIIIFSVMFSTIGVFLGFAFGGREISIIFTGIGIISLAGIVVNNAIVLIDYINLLIHRKVEEKGLESSEQLSKEEVKAEIMKGGATRLRPVLLTAITTVLGLIPLALGFNFNFFTFISDLDPQIFIGGDNAAFWGPMAWTVIYGLVFATFLTLVVVPAMYWLFYRLKLSLKKVFTPKQKKEVSPVKVS